MTAPAPTPTIPARRPVAAFYLYYVALYAPVAIIISFFPLWIRAQGLTDRQTGLVLALGSALAVVVNPLVGAMADQARSRKTILLVLVAGSVASAGLLFAVDGFVGVLLVFLAMRACATSLSLSESIALGSVSRYGFNFGRLRSAGSMSVVAMSVILGWLIDRAGAGVIAWVLLVAYIAQGLFAMTLPGDSVRVGQRVRGPVMQVLRLPGFALLLGSAAVSQACHGFFYSYSVLFWKSVGFPASVIGYLWALGVVAEIVVFSVSGRIVARVAAPGLIALACMAGVLRWTLIGLAPRVDVAIVAQLLQGATLALTQLGAAEYIRTRVPAAVLSSGTGVYAACGGLFTAFCVYLGSFLFPSVGGRAFLLSSALCTLGAILALILRARERRATVSAPRIV